MKEYMPNQYIIKYITLLSGIMMIITFGIPLYFYKCLVYFYMNGCINMTSVVSRHEQVTDQQDVKVRAVQQNKINRTKQKLLNARMKKKYLQQKLEGERLRNKNLSQQICKLKQKSTDKDTILVKQHRENIELIVQNQELKNRLRIIKQEVSRNEEDQKNKIQI